VFDVGHLQAVKAKLKALLTSEITLICEMSHTGETTDQTMESEGMLLLPVCTFHIPIHDIICSQSIAMLETGLKSPAITRLESVPRVELVWS
jgi:hypothetical protein